MPTDYLPYARRQARLAANEIIAGKKLRLRGIFKAFNAMTEDQAQTIAMDFAIGNKTNAAEFDKWIKEVFGDFSDEPRQASGRKRKTKTNDDNDDASTDSSAIIDKEQENEKKALAHECNELETYLALLKKRYTKRIKLKAVDNTIAIEQSKHKQLYASLRSICARPLSLTASASISSASSST